MAETRADPAARMACALRAWAMVLPLVVSAGAAWAQQTELLPSAAVRCLTPPPERMDEPEYPFKQLKHRVAGRVKVKLTFEDGSSGPDVEVLESEHDEDGDFADAVEKHVKALRVPCMGAGETPVRLTQEYVFKPDQRKIFWSSTSDLADAERKKQLACMVHVANERQPTYPWLSERKGIQGRVVAHLKFVAPDQPPVVSVYSRAQAQDLAEATQDWIKGLRLPCHKGGVVEVSQVHIFVFKGDAYGFKPLTLQQLMGSVKGIRSQRLRLNTYDMDCPFDLRLLYYMPYLPNGIGQVGTSDPSRRPLIDWLKTIELDLPDRSLNAVFADDTILTVPCLKIDLNPQSPQKE